MQSESPIVLNAARSQALVRMPFTGLDEDLGVGIAGHIWVCGKTTWGIIGDDAPQFPENAPLMPYRPSRSTRALGGEPKPSFFTSRRRVD